MQNEMMMLEQYGKNVANVAFLDDDQIYVYLVI